MGWLIFFGMMAILLIWGAIEKSILNSIADEECKDFNLEKETADINKIVEMYRTRIIECPICGFKIPTFNGKKSSVCEHYPR